MSDPQDPPQTDEPQQEPAAPTENEAGPAPDVAALEARVAELEAEVGGLKDRWLRARADYDNLVRRTNNEREALTAQAAARVVEHLLEPLDILARAARDAEGSQDAHAQGIRLTHKSLRAALEREGLQEVPGTGAPFDVAVHEAVASEPSESPAGTITDVIRAGYRLHGKLLRAALVKVSTGPAEAPPKE